MCNHPASALKPETAHQENGTVTLKFFCVDCLAPITKIFMLTVPEPENPASEIGALLAAEDGAPQPEKLRGANSPWRRWEGKAATV